MLMTALALMAQSMLPMPPVPVIPPPPLPDEAHLRGRRIDEALMLLPPGARIGLMQMPDGITGGFIDIELPTCRYTVGLDASPTGAVLGVGIPTTHDNKLLHGQAARECIAQLRPR